MSTHRHYHDNPRSSNGTFYSTSYDTTSSTQPGRSSVSGVSGHSSVTYEAQPIQKSIHHGGKTSKTKYAVRPRQNSVTDAENRRSLAIATRSPSPPRRGSVIPAPREPISPSVVRDDSSRYLQPVSSHIRLQQPHHQRQSSTGRAEIGGYASTRDRREKAYHTRGPSVYDGQKSYHSSRPQAPRHQDEDGWSYTNPHEQFDRDFPQRVITAPRRDSQVPRERPSTVYEPERQPVRRDYGPPRSSNRQLERIDKVEPARLKPRPVLDSDLDRSNDIPPRRQSMRAPVLHQQPVRDDGYSSARDDPESRGHHRVRDDRYEDELSRRDRPGKPSRGSDRDREYRKDHERASDRDRTRDHDRGDKVSDVRRKQRSRDPSPERSGFKALAAGALGTLATAGALGASRSETKEKDVESDGDDDRDYRNRRHRRHRRGEERSDESDEPELRKRDDLRRARHPDEPADDISADQEPKRRHSRRRHRRDSEVPEDKTGIDREPRPRSTSRARFRDEPQSDPESHTYQAAQSHRPETLPADIETRTMSPGENEDERPRRVQLVEPVKENQDTKPKGILKPARQVPFPEDPNPIREGVAPLKDATKDGIPTNARWTKINRVLVNPEALEKYHERFEEREDYVIVLRVLTREEIQKLASKTKEIREARGREWQQKLEERRQRRAVSGHDDEPDQSDNEEGDGTRPQLAIEQGPAQPVDLRNLQNTQNAQNTPTQIPSIAMPGSLPPAHDDFDKNYSQNV